MMFVEADIWDGGDRDDGFEGGVGLVELGVGSSLDRGSWSWG